LRRQRSREEGSGAEGGSQETGAAKKAAKPAKEKGEGISDVYPHIKIIRRPIITEKGLGVKELHTP